MNTRKMLIALAIAGLLAIGGIVGVLAQGASASDIKGTVTVLATDSIVVDAETTILIDSNTKVEGSLTTGSVVEIKARVLEDGKLLATKIEASSETDVDEDNGNEDYLELKGTINDLTDDSFDIGDNTIFIGDSTKIEGQLVEGATIEVEAITQDNGSLLAVEIEVEDDEMDEQSSDEEDVDEEEEDEGEDTDEMDESED